MGKQGKPAGPPPDAAALREAALRHLARFGTTEAGLRGVLERRVRRWERAAADEGRNAADEVLEEALRLAGSTARAMAEAGAVDDAAFAAARAARGARTGRSRRVVAAQLAAHGVDAETVRATLAATGEGTADELPAGAVYARKRRLGPFRPEPNAETRSKDAAALARAGFGREVTERLMGLDRDEAETLVLAARRGS